MRAIRLRFSAQVIIYQKKDMPYNVIYSVEQVDEIDEDGQSLSKVG